jgi:hypothetical protein
MAKVGKSLFSPSDLYHMADKIVEMYDKFDLLFKFAKMEDDLERMNTYSTITWELNLLIEAYGLREMVKIK